jgi:hypothetical protein
MGRASRVGGIENESKEFFGYPEGNILLERQRGRFEVNILPPKPYKSVKLLLALASTMISYFSLFGIHYYDFYSPLDTCAFQNGASSSTKKDVGLTVSLGVRRPSGTRDNFSPSFFNYFRQLRIC